MLWTIRSGDLNLRITIDNYRLMIEFVSLLEDHESFQSVINIELHRYTSVAFPEQETYNAMMMA